MREKTYVLPKRVLTRVLAKLNEIANLDVRSAANALMHVIGRYHTAPGTFGRHFFLCRQQLAVHPEMEGHSEWHIREATKALQNLKIIRKLWSAAKARRRVDGIRKAPTLFDLHPLWACIFPAALKPRPPRPQPSPVYGGTSQDSLFQESNPVRVVHTGEPVETPPEPAPPRERTAFDGDLDRILAGVLAHAAVRAS